MANHYIRQDIERRMILLGLTDEEIAVYINAAIAEKIENKTGQTWLLFYLHFEEALNCSKCGKIINRQIVYLGLCDNKIDEVLCDACWRTMSEWRKEEE